MARCWHEWRPLAGRPFLFSCAQCLLLSACPVCLGLGDRGELPAGVEVRYCQEHLVGFYMPLVSHEHRWERLSNMVGLFGCSDESCVWCAVCPGCLNSLNVALRVREGIPGVALYWCPEHGSLEADDAISA